MNKSDVRSQSSSRKSQIGGGGSVYSQARQLQRKNNMREEMISKKITEIFKEKEMKMMRIIETTIYEDRLRIYKLQRTEFEEELSELDKERQKIVRNRKKNKKERNKALKANTRSQLLYMVRALQATVIFYRELYYENDYYRYKKLFELAALQPSDQKKQTAQLNQLNEFFNSPFKDDRKFVVKYMAQLTRDRITEAKEHIENLFFDKIFNMLLKTTDENNRLMSFDILCNLVNSDLHRKKLAKEGYFKQVYQTMKIGDIDEKTLTKMSWLTALICYHHDMIELIGQLKLLPFIIKLVENKYSVAIRSNAVLGIQLLTYHEKLFDELLASGVIDLVMELSMDKNCDLSVKINSTLALVHFALSKKSINLLIDRNIMDLFNGLNSIDNGEIQTNISWIFLALCNNGITGKQMLENGITRDMFLASCNPQFHQIRHLVIAGFAELGRSTEFKSDSKKRLNGTLQRIKEKAIVGTHETFKGAAEHTIDVLLKFSISQTGNFKLTAFRALKDYILLNHKNLISDLQGIICAFVHGSASDSDLVRLECANAISFLITHHLVFTEKEMLLREEKRPADLPYWEFFADQNYILDALMLLTGSDSRDVRTRAFSTLSTLSTYASQNPQVMHQIQQDIKIPENIASKQYFLFIKDRLIKSCEAFQVKYKTQRIEQEYAGLFCLLRLAQEPTEMVTEEATVYLHAFFYPEYHKDLFEAAIMFKEEDQKEKNFAPIQDHPILTKKEKEQICVNLYANECYMRSIKLDSLNEKFFMYVFKALLFSKNPKIVYQLLDVVNFYVMHETLYQKEILDPSIILWMLKILHKHRKDRELCLFAAKTILRVVSNHQIEFDYREMTIIKKFNLALENIDTDPNVEIDEITDSEEQWNEIERQKEEEEAASEAIQNEEIKEQLEMKLQSLLSPTAQAKLDQVEGGSAKLNLTDEVLSPNELVRYPSTIIDNEQEQAEKQKQMGHYRPTIPSNTEQMPDTTQVIQSFENPISDHHQSEMPASPQSFELMSSVGSKANSVSLEGEEKSQLRKTELLSQDQLQEQEEEIDTVKIDLTSPPVRHLSDLGNILQDIQSYQRELTLGSRKISIFKKARTQTPSSIKTQVVIDPNAELRDALIKSFMLVFTNEKSQHLLLNNDIIDIAFNCLEFCESISIEAQANLSRLISIIFKFPQVQQFLKIPEVIHGIVHLLKQTQNETILKFAVKACTYISYNFDFLNSDMSLLVLKAMTPLLDRLSNKSAGLKDDVVMSSDKDNCVLTISNLLKGRNQNSVHFIKNDGPRRIMEYMLSPTCQQEVVELCIGCLKQFADHKILFKMMLDHSEANQRLLPACIKKCLEISDTWHESSKEIHLYKKIFAHMTMTDEGKRHLAHELNMKKQRDIEKIMNMSYKNIDELKEIDSIDSQNDLSIKMAASCKIRSHVLYTAASCLKHGFEINYMIRDCQLMTRVLSDFSKDNLNDYIYIALLKVLQSSRKQNELVLHICLNYSDQIFDVLNSTPIIEKKIALLKIIVFIALQVPLQLSDRKPEFFQKIFTMATSQENLDIIESVVWLISSLLQLSDSEELLQKLIQILLHYKAIPLVFKALQFSQEKIVLQSLKTLSTFASFPHFKATLIIEQGDTLFQLLAKIINERLDLFQIQRLEIETTLVEILSFLTESEFATKDPTTVEAKRRVAQQGFMEHFLLKVSALKYRFEKEDMVKFDEDDLLGDSNVDQSMTDLPIRYSQDELYNQLQKIEDLGRLKDSNLLIENTYRLASHVTDLHETQQQLVNGDCRLLGLVIDLFSNMITQLGENQVQMMQLSYSNLRIVKHASQICVNLCSNQAQGGIDPAIMQEICQRKNLTKSLRKVLKQINDYDLHSNIYKALSMLVLSSSFNVQKKAVEQGCLQEIIIASDKSQFFRVRRLCQTTINKVESSLFELNERISKKRNKA